MKRLIVTADDFGASNEVNDAVVNSPNDGICSNGAFCDGIETCGGDPCDAVRAALAS